MTPVSVDDLRTAAARATGELRISQARERLEQGNREQHNRELAFARALRQLGIEPPTDGITTLSVTGEPAFQLRGQRDNYHDHDRLIAVLACPACGAFKLARSPAFSRVIYTLADLGDILETPRTEPCADCAEFAPPSSATHEPPPLNLTLEERLREALSELLGLSNEVAS